MTMPLHLVAVRHGESEGNVAARAARAGDLSAFTDEFVTTPGHQWNLTETGIAQAWAIGSWLGAAARNGELGAELDGGAPFERAYVSPYVRTAQTAGHLGRTSGLDLIWFKNRAIRERDWGDIGTTPMHDFAERYPDNARQASIDPLYWVPPGGESIAHVAENRVRNFLDTLHREATGAVLAVTHGEFMQALRLVLERIDDSGFTDIRTGENRLGNGEALHYTRVNPEPGPHHGELANSLRWVRRARPILLDGTHTGTALEAASAGEWGVSTTPWRRIEFAAYTGDDLIAGRPGSIRV